MRGRILTKMQCKKGGDDVAFTSRSSTCSPGERRIKSIRPFLRTARVTPRPPTSDGKLNINMRKMAVSRASCPCTMARHRTRMDEKALV